MLKEKGLKLLKLLVLLSPVVTWLARKFIRRASWPSCAVLALQLEIDSMIWAVELESLRQLVEGHRVAFSQVLAALEGLNSTGVELVPSRWAASCGAARKMAALALRPRF